MNKIMDKLFSKVKINKKFFVFLLVLTLLALISGSLFTVMLDKADKAIITSYLKEFLTNISKNKIDYISVLKDSLFANTFLVVLIWLLGISVIGIPIILFLYFSQVFTFGFALSSIILNYKFKGVLFALIYAFPNNLIFLLVLLLLVSYSLILSIKLITTVIKKKQIDFKIISNKYVRILVISIIASFLCSIYETFALPNIIKLIIPILN